MATSAAPGGGSNRPFNSVAEVREAILNLKLPNMPPLSTTSALVTSPDFDHSRVLAYKPNSWASPMDRDEENDHDHEQNHEDSSNDDDDREEGEEEEGTRFVPQPLRSNASASSAGKTGSSQNSRRRLVPPLLRPGGPMASALLLMSPADSSESNARIISSMSPGRVAAATNAAVVDWSAASGPHYLQIAQFQNAAPGFLSPTAHAVSPSPIVLSPLAVGIPMDSASTGPATPTAPFPAMMEAASRNGSIAAAGGAVAMRGLDPGPFSGKRVDLISGITHCGDSPNQLAESYFVHGWPQGADPAGLSFTLPPAALPERSAAHHPPQQQDNRMAVVGRCVAPNSSAAPESTVNANQQSQGGLLLQGQTLALTLMKEYNPEDALAVARAAVSLLKGHVNGSDGAVGGSRHSDLDSPSPHEVDAELKVGASGLPSVKLVHPDEFKNPSTFLKIYGDPLCFAKSGPLPKKGKNGNWECSKCGNVNFPRRFRCNLCGTTRDDEGDKIVCDYARQVYERYIYVFRNPQPDPPPASSTGPSRNNGNYSGNNGGVMSNGMMPRISTNPGGILHATAQSGGVPSGQPQRHNTQSTHHPFGGPLPHPPTQAGYAPTNNGLRTNYGFEQHQPAAAQVQPPLWTADPAILGASDSAGRFPPGRQPRNSGGNKGGNNAGQGGQRHHPANHHGGAYGVPAAPHLPSHNNIGRGANGFGGHMQQPNNNSFQMPQQQQVSGLLGYWEEKQRQQQTTPPPAFVAASGKNASAMLIGPPLTTM